MIVGIRTSAHGKRKPIRARVFGVWAVHRGHGLHRSGWVVTHIPTGLKMPNVCTPSKKIAAQIARALARAVPFATSRAVKAHRATVQLVLAKHGVAIGG